MPKNTYTAIHYPPNTPSSLLKKHHELDKDILFFTRHYNGHPMKLEVIYLNPITKQISALLIWRASEENKSDPAVTIKQLIIQGVIEGCKETGKPKDLSEREVFEYHQAHFSEEEILKEKRLQTENEQRFFISNAIRVRVASESESDRIERIALAGILG